MSSKSLMRPSCICTEARKRASLLTCVSCSAAHLAWSTGRGVGEGKALEED